MIKIPITLQELRKKIYIKAKAEKHWRFWGLHVHICKLETLREAYRLAKQNKGASGIDGVTFEMIEKQGMNQFLVKIQDELLCENYFPDRKRIVTIPKDNGGSRKLSIPNIKDRVVEGAVKLILEPIFEADFQSGCYGYRPKKTAGEAIERVTVGAIKGKVRVIDIDLRSYFDNIAHAELFKKIAKRVHDDNVMRLLKLIVKTAGKKGIAQGSPLSPLLSNIYLNEVDKMLEKAKAYTKSIDGFEHIEYARWADDLIILIDGYRKWQWLERAVIRRVKEELSKIKVELNEEKTKIVDLRKGETFSFLGFDFRKVKTQKGKDGIHKTPRMKARTKLLSKLKVIFSKHKSQPVGKVIDLVNPILRGWVNYYRIGNSSRCFKYVKDWTAKKVRRQLMKARGYKGFGWNKWSTAEIFEMGLYNDYQIRYYDARKHAQSISYRL